MALTPSFHQQKIFDFVQYGSGNGVIEAVAGSGKTTTVLGALAHTRGKAIFLAFNKSIATELAERVPGNTQARTFHSMCYSPVLRAMGIASVNENKMSELMKRVMTYEENVMYGAFVRKLVGLAKQAGVGCLAPNVDQLWYDLADHHDVKLDHDDADQDRAFELAREILARSNESNSADFDDLLYFAVLKGIALTTFDWVFVDEAQDTNAIQRAILRKILKPGGRLVAVGDPAQAIYGFRGADSQSLNLIVHEFNAQRFPLSVSYRCATEVVRYAKQWVDHIEPSDTAPTGVVNVFDTKWQLTDFGADDIVVCRTTAPLIQLAYKLLAARIPCRILGREIGQGLIRIIDKMRANSIDDLVNKLEAYHEREYQKAIAKMDEAGAAAIDDRVAAITCLVNSLPEDDRTIAELKRVMDSLFTGDANRLTLCTIHKSKGLEADTVWWLNRSLCPSKWAKREWQQEQERNLCYVAATRAKTTLNLIELGEEN